MRGYDESQKFEIKKMLFEVHSNKHLAIRQKIHLTTERYITLLFAIVAFFNTDFVKVSSSLTVRILLCVMLVIIMGAILYRIYRDNQASLMNAKIVGMLNEEFGLFEKGRFVTHEVIYPEKWKNWGQENAFKGVLLHFSIIILLTGLAICSILFAPVL